MSDNVIPFNNEEEQEDCCCPTCDLVFEFMDYVKHVAKDQTDEELFEVLSDLVTEAKILGLKEHISREIDSKVQFLNHLISLDEDCCDGECDC